MSRTRSIAVLALGLAVLVVEAAAKKNGIERWTCSPVGLAALSCQESLGRSDDPDCTRVSLTADMGDGTGTIQVTGMPEELTRFVATQFDRGWVWPFTDPRHAFAMNHNRTGFYFASLPTQGEEAEPAGVFHCQRERN